MSPPPEGALQPNGTRSPEAVFDSKHVGETIVHIASLPLDVTVLTFNIMYVSVTFHLSLSTALGLDSNKIETR